MTSPATDDVDGAVDPSVKILALDHSPELGGAEIGLLNLADELTSRMEVALFEDGPFGDLLRSHGHHPRVLGIGADGPSLQRSAGLLSRLAGTVSQARRLRRRLGAVVEESGASVLVVNTLRAALLLSLCGIRLRVPVMVMIRDGLRPPYLSPLDAIASQVLVSLRASVVVANSAWTRSTIRTRRPSHVVTPCLARDLFDTEPAHRQGAVRVLVLGRLAAWKGQHVALAAAELVGTTVDWSVTIAGGSWFGEEAYARALQEQARGLDVDVEFVGHVDDVKSLIDAHDVVVHCSTMPEPFGQVVVQGMARGRLVIASDAGGPSTIIEDEVDGLLVAPGDVPALARAIERGVGDDALRARLGSAARRSASRYHPQKTTEAFLGVVLDVIGRRSERSVT